MTEPRRTDRLLVTFARHGLGDRPQDRERQPRGLEGSTAARWLARRLTERIDAGAMGEPKAEAWAWTLPIRRDGGRIVLGIAAYRDNRRETWNDWLIQVLPSGFAVRPALRRRRAEALRATLDALHEALVTDPEVRAVRWHRRRDLNRGREELGAADPFAPPPLRQPAPAVAPVESADPEPLPALATEVPPEPVSLAPDDETSPPSEPSSRPSEPASAASKPAAYAAAGVTASEGV